MNESTTPTGAASNGVEEFLSGFGSTPTPEPGAAGTPITAEALMTFLEKNQGLFFKYLVIAVGVFWLIGRIIRWYTRYRSMKAPGPVKLDALSFTMKVCCIVLMAGLISCDYISLMNMFKLMRFDAEERPIFAFAFALFLEGFPFVLGIVLPKVRDPIQAIEGKKDDYKLIARICTVCMLISFALAVGLRYLFVTAPARGGWEAYMNEQFMRNPNKNDVFLGQLFLFCSPILTSILALVVSWVAFGSNNLDDLATQLRKHQERFNWYEQAYGEYKHCYQDARNSLWITVGHKADDEPLENFEEFRLDCHAKIHDMIIGNCMDAYPSLLKRYNERIEAALSGYVQELADYSTIPHLITRITVQDIIREYNKTVKEPVDNWNYEVCEQQMAGDLESMLSKSVIVAQFKYATRKYNFERDR